MKREPSDLISATKLIEELKSWKVYTDTDLVEYHNNLILAIDKARKYVAHIETTEEWESMRKELEDGEV